MGVHDCRVPEVQKESEAELTDIASKDRNKVPKYADKLKNTEIEDRVAYARELSKKK